MARMAETDFLQSMRFHVLATVSNVANPFRYKVVTGQTSDGVDVEAQAGFSAVTTPEVSVEVVEYHEGHHIYTHKFPGRPTVSDVTLSRGVAIEDTDFIRWMIQAIEGSDEHTYRADLLIYHGGRAGLPRASKVSLDETHIAVGGPTRRYSIGNTPTRAYELKEAFPIRCKVAGDLDATSGDISVAELDIAYETFCIHTFVAPPVA